MHEIIKFDIVSTAPLAFTPLCLYALACPYSDAYVQLSKNSGAYRATRMKRLYVSYNEHSNGSNFRELGPKVPKQASKTKARGKKARVQSAYVAQHSFSRIFFFTMSRLSGPAHSRPRATAPHSSGWVPSSYGLQHLDTLSSMTNPCIRNAPDRLSRIQEGALVTHRRIDTS